MRTTLLLLTLAPACQSAAIEGQVLDHAGQGLAGVTVAVEKSTWSAQTDTLGRYSVPFAPGSFTVSYSKPAHTSESVDLDIQGTVAFPAAEVTLFPQPAEKGLYVLGSDGPKGLGPAAMDIQKVASGWTTRTKVFCTGEGDQVLPAGAATFIDTSPIPYRLARLGGYGLVWQNGDPEEGEVYDGRIVDERERKGAEGLVLRKTTLTPGQWAWIQHSKQGEKLTIDKTGSCFPFKVE